MKFITRVMVIAIVICPLVLAQEFQDPTDYTSVPSSKDASQLFANSINDLPTEKSAAEEDPILLEYIESELWTGIGDVIVVGIYAYCLSQHGLLVLDISDPSNPTFVSKLYLQGNSATSRMGLAWVPFNYIYATNGSSGLRIIDISNPHFPILVGTCDTPGEATDVAVSGNYAYVADFDYDLQIIDISDKSNPFIVGSYESLEWTYDVAVSGNFAYVATATYDDFHVIDISDPASPSLVGSYDFGARVVTVSGDYAFVGGQTGFNVIDILNPYAPTITGSCESVGSVFGLTISGGYAYTVDYQYGLQIIDISNLSSPTQVGSHDTPGNAWNVAVNGNYAFIADDYSGLQVIDVTTPSSPVQAGSYETPTEVNRVAVSGIYAYEIGSEGILRVINISNPAMPTISGNCSVPSSARSLAVSGNYAYIGGGFPDAFYIVDISNPSNPNLITSLNTPDIPNDIVISGNNAYVALGIGLAIIDITDPAGPLLVGSYSSSDIVSGVAVSGNYAYLATDFTGLEIIDISNPSSPTLAGSVEYIQAYDVKISGDYAILACGYYIGIADISNPLSPTFVTYISIAGNSWRIDISGDYAFVASGGGGIEVLDIFYPPLATLVGSYDTPGNSLDAVVAGDYVYVADRTAFMILRYETNCGVSDTDSDGIPNLCDNCPQDYNPTQEDLDGDRLGDICDNCIQVFNPDQTDADADSIGNACVECSVLPGDIDNSGIVDMDDWSLLFDFVFNTVFPPPTPMGLGEIDGYDLPTISDVISFYDFLNNGGAPPICPYTFSKYQPNQSSQYVVSYDDVFPANATSMTLHINLNSITEIRGLTLPLEILVDGSFPGSISCDYGDYWSSIFDYKSLPFLTEDGQLRYGGFSSASGSIPSGEGALLEVDLHVDSPSSNPRPIVVQFGQYRYPYVKDEFVNYPMVVQQTAPGTLIGWEPLITGCDGFCENTMVGTNVQVNLSPDIVVTFGEIYDGGNGTTEFSINTCSPEEDPKPDGMFVLGDTYYCITTTANDNGDITLCITYDDSQVIGPEGTITVHHWNGSSWGDPLPIISQDEENNIICVSTPSLSPFILAQPIQYTCGDIDGVEGVNILDIVYLINYKYKDGPAPYPLESADVNSDFSINILDIVYLINYKYKGGNAPACPW